MTKNQINKAAKISSNLEYLLEKSEALFESANQTFQNKSEKWQESEAGKTAQENIRSLELGLVFLADSIGFFRELESE